MNKLIFLRITLAALLVNSAVEGQLHCLVGMRTTTGSIITAGSLTSTQCPSGTASACHIFEISVTIAGNAGRAKLTFNLVFLLPSAVLFCEWI